jgi:hypothetical protein
VLVDVLATGADWVTSSAVRAEYRGVAVQAGKVFSVARSRALVGTIENIVRLVGSMPDITPEESSGNWIESV